MVAVNTELFANIYFTKSSGSKTSVSKNKAVKKESSIRVQN
jgi:hypothetical protein